jgi:hypothetical protein
MRDSVGLSDFPGFGGLRNLGQENRTRRVLVAVDKYQRLKIPGDLLESGGSLSAAEVELQFFVRRWVAVVMFPESQ